MSITKRKNLDDAVDSVIYQGLSEIFGRSIARLSTMWKSIDKRDRYAKETGLKANINNASCSCCCGDCVARDAASVSDVVVEALVVFRVDFEGGLV
jgi:hypothetical protein